MLFASHATSSTRTWHILTPTSGTVYTDTAQKTHRKSLSILLPSLPYSFPAPAQEYFTLTTPTFHPSIRQTYAWPCSLELYLQQVAVPLPHVQLGHWLCNIYLSSNRPSSKPIPQTVHFCKQHLQTERKRHNKTDWERCAVRTSMDTSDVIWSTSHFGYSVLKHSNRSFPFTRLQGEFDTDAAAGAGTWAQRRLCWRTSRWTLSFAYLSHISQ